MIIETQRAHLKKDKVSGACDYAKYLVPRTYMMQDWAGFSTRRCAPAFID
jgi:hypothetical protein